MIRISAVFVALALLLSGTSLAARPEGPSLKPRPGAAPGDGETPAPVVRPLSAPPSAASPGLPPGPATPVPALAASRTSSAEAAYLERAFAAAARGSWGEVARMQYEAPSQILRDLILWKRASDGAPGTTFDELNLALTSLSNWPKTTDIRRRAEDIIDGSSLPPSARIQWLEASGPITGAGKVALANAYAANGNRTKAEEVIRDVWRHNTLDTTLARTVLARYGQALSRDDHHARAEFLLWTGQQREAEALRPQLSADYRALMDARLALARRGRNVDALVRAVPDHLQSNPGLMYERARWRRTNDQRDGATQLLAGINGRDVPVSGRSRLWSERALAVRDDLKNRNYARAYRLAAPHGMNSGASFAEAEWLAGWIALRLNGDATRAVSHFETMAAGVGAPVSVSRGQYWTGRARDALGQQDAAREAYTAAAAFKYTYYGQLASERIGDRTIEFAAVQPSAEQAEAFEEMPLIQALRLIGQTGQMGMFREFSHHVDDVLDTPEQYELLAQLNHGLSQHDTAVRAGKAGLQRGIIAPGAAYPVILHPFSRQPQVETAYILAITRQESEFNPNARSPVGALGLMQFMPSTARAEARLRGMPYEQAWLTTNPAYNMTLGGLHLDTLLSQFGGSYIMTAAAYNAGPSRPSQWVRDYGDPRAGQIDPIDWVEFVPFSETRNYIQRVMENIQVYRHRLSGQPEEIRLTDDLKRGRR
ncbi:transglycosylase SLT domain-containing protein [Hyphomonas sp.]|uniref:lytic transglycosylase domain-containing protein n=1 Tax=Hyphomonas sp. TaxID=87 RepID=UPI00391926E8